MSFCHPLGPWLAFIKLSAVAIAKHVWLCDGFALPVILSLCVTDNVFVCDADCDVCNCDGYSIADAFTLCIFEPVIVSYADCVRLRFAERIRVALGVWLLVPNAVCLSFSDSRYGPIYALCVPVCLDLRDGVSGLQLVRLCINVSVPYSVRLLIGEPVRVILRIDDALYEPVAVCQRGSISVSDRMRNVDAVAVAVRVGVSLPERVRVPLTVAVRDVCDGVGHALPHAVALRDS